MDASSAARATGHAGDRCYSSVGFLIVAGGGEGRGDPPLSFTRKSCSSSFSVNRLTCLVLGKDQAPT